MNCSRRQGKRSPRIQLVRTFARDLHPRTSTHALAVRELQRGDLRIRIVEYTPGYIADHWCAKGHVVYCLEGELLTELRDGRAFVLRPGMSYQVADGESPHRSSTVVGARVFIVD
jgi:quercetin dioxygenase-like cupin family protein